MGRDVNIPFAGEYYKEISTKIDAQDTVNLYNIIDTDGAHSMAGIPGYALAKVLQIGSKPVRGLMEDTDNSRAFAIAGSNVYLLDTSLNTTLIGTLGTDTGPVYISANTPVTQIMFVDGQSGYIYDVGGGTFTQITDAGFPANPIRVVFLDAFFIVVAANDRFFYISAPNDGTKWNILNNRAQAFAESGPLIGCEVVNRRLFLFKRQSVEVWWNAGQADFPLRRDNNMIFSYGCASVASISQTDLGLMFWLASDSSGVGSVMLSDNGKYPIPISSPAIDKFIQQLTTPTDAVGFVFKNDDGNIFYQLSFTADDETLIYNHTAPRGYQWTRLQRIPKKTVGYKKRHPANCYMYFLGKHFFGSFSAPNIYEMSLDIDTYETEPIQRIRIMKAFSSPKRMRINSLILDVQTGIGDVTGIYTNPLIYLSMSRDAGKSFGNEIAAFLGKLGKRNVRAIWRKLGITDGPNGVIFKISVYASVSPIIILNATANIDELKT